MENKFKGRLSYSKKNANNKEWYKYNADILESRFSDRIVGYNDVSDLARMRVNYDLFNNKIDIKEFEYVCKPFGNDVGELPAKMENRDIVSGKIKAMLGMEMKRPFTWNVVATDDGATTRKEQQEFGMMKDYVINSIIQPIKQQIEIEQQQQIQGQELNQDQIQQIQEKINQELKVRTPEEVKQYMKREHQDPAEVMSNHLLKYLIQKCDIKRKFNEVFKHGLLSAYELGYVGVLNGEPEFWVVNPKRFNCASAGDSLPVEDREWVTCNYPMTPSEIIKYFGNELSNKDIDRIYENWSPGAYEGNEEDLFRVLSRSEFNDTQFIDVIHCQWKGLRKIGFLNYYDELGQEQSTIVDESYIFNEDFGDISIEWEWIPEVYETWKIKTSEPIYVNMRPVPGQFKDLENLYHCKLSYKGIVYDDMNSVPTSLMDRLKVYQYYYNIILYKIELLISSDKGKKLFMNIGNIPQSQGIDVKKWQYFFEATPFAYFDPMEEGTQYQDANTVGKVIDMSLASDIQKYIELAEYIRTQAGRSVGITDQVEGQVSPQEAVTNARQNLVQSSHILEIYFNYHSLFKKNILQSFIEVSKIAYAESRPRKLSYILDDMSIQMFDFDIGLLENSTLGLFLSDDSKAEESKELIRQLAHAALQNQKVELSDVMAVIRKDNLREAEEVLQVAEDNRREFEQSIQQQQLESDQKLAEDAREFKREKHEMEKEIIVLKEEERRKTVIAQSALTGLSFNPEVDQDRDGVPDFLEIAKHGVDAEIKRDKQDLDREKFEHQKVMDSIKTEQENKKLAIQKAKNQQKSVKP